MEMAVVLKQVSQIKQTLVSYISFPVNLVVQTLMYFILLSNPPGNRYSSHNGAIFTAAER
jgi:hypothetical protein